MASNHDYFLAGDQETGKALVANALTQLGFEVTPTPNGGFTAKRGSFTKTMWLGAMAGKNFHVTFVVEFFTDPQGNLVARLSRSLGGGMAKGGAIGVAKTETAFGETAASLLQLLSASQRLLGNAAVA